MERRMSKNIRLGALAAGVAVLLVAFNLLVMLLSGDAYFDQTPDKRYSLSAQTQSFLELNNEEIGIRLYISKDLLKQNPALGQYAEYIRKLLYEYQRQSRGKVYLSVIEVVPFSSAEAAAEKAGIKSFEFGDGKAGVYLGASFTNAEGITRVVAQFWPQRQPMVEDDISRVLSVLAGEKMPVLGIMSPFFKAVNGKTSHLFAKDMAFVEQLAVNGYQIVSLSDGVAEIPVGVDAVLVFYPLNLDRMGQYALDQYLMRGGKVMIMQDAFADERYRVAEEYVNYNSGLKEFLKNMGVEYSETLLVGDNRSSQQVVLEGKRVQYPPQMLINKERMGKHPIMDGLVLLKLNHSGFFSYQLQEGINTTILFETGEDSGIMPAEVMIDASYDNLLKNYTATKKKYPLALLLEGKFKSLFQAPIVSDVAIMEQMQYSFLSVPQREGKVILVADSDMLTISTWMDYSQDISYPYQAVFTSDNLYFVRNALDYLTDNGFVGVAMKENILPQHLAGFFYQKAAAKYAEEKAKETQRQLKARGEIIAVQDKMALLPVSSIQQLKTMEQFKREEMAAEENLRRIGYQTKEKYQDFLDMFALLTIVLIPLVGCLAVGGIYFIYNCRMKSKAGEYIDE